MGVELARLPMALFISFMIGIPIGLAVNWLCSPPENGVKDASQSQFRDSDLSGGTSHAQQLRRHAK